MYCVETSDLSHRFSEDEHVLNGIDIRVPEGAIYGFLGPNGAGKTTTLRLILGLIRKQHGDIQLFGRSIQMHRRAILKKTGSLIDSPSVYSHLTAMENLEVLQKVYQCPKSRISEVLEIVGLPDTGNKRAGKFSLGMKQRLSIAMAILHQPALLILDEPGNGLDPNGIIDMRELLKSLNRDQGMTIIISSHLLSEVAKLATHAGIIHKGKLLFQGTMDDLQQNQLRAASTGFLTSDLNKTADVMKQIGLEAVVQNGQVVIPVADMQTIAEANRRLVSGNVDVYGITAYSNDLESIFIDLIKNES